MTPAPAGEGGVDSWSGSEGFAETPTQPRAADLPSENC